MGRPTVTRRKSIAIGATALTAGLGGLALASDPAGAQADVSLGEMQVDAGDLETEDGTFEQVWATATGTYEYSTPDDPAEWDAYLLVGHPEESGTEAIGITSGDATAQAGSGSYAIRGPITAASFWDAAAFAVEPGAEPTTLSIPLRVTFVVYDDANQPLVEASVADTADVTVRYTGATATLSASAAIVGQDNADDPTPELPEA